MTTAVLNPPTLQATLIAALERDQPERALEQAFIQLSRGGDLNLLLAMLKALVRCGVAGLAERLLRSSSGVLAAEPHLAALAEQLSRLPSGIVPSATIRTRQSHCLDHLLRGREYLEPLVQQFESACDGFTVFQSLTGNVFVIRGRSNDRLDLVFPFADHRAHAAAARIPPATLSTSFRLHGVPSVPIWQRLIALRTECGFLPPIDLLEPDVDVLGIWLGLIEQPDVLDGDRIGMFVGGSAGHDFEQFLADHPWRTPASQVLTTHRPNWRPPCVNAQLLESICNRRKNDRTAIVQSLEARDRNRDVQFWRSRFRTAGRNDETPLRIAGFTTRFSTVIQHSMRGLAQAFRRAGCEFDLIMQPSASCPFVDVVGALAQKDYDLIVVINHLRSEFDDFKRLNVPYVCWIQDHMDQLCDRRAGQSVGELDLVLGHSPQVMSSLYEYPANRCLPTSNLADPTTYTNAPIPKQKIDQFRCDVSFAGHGSASPEQLVAEITRGMDGRICAVFERFLELISQWMATRAFATPIDQLQLLVDAEHDTGSEMFSPEIRRSRVFPQAARIYDRLFRHQALEWVAQWARGNRRTFRIHGRAWESHPTLPEFAAGEVQSGEDMRCLVLASAINLQINGHGSLHQRLLDGLAAGGLMLARYNPADFVRQPFETIQRFISARTIASLPDLVAISEREPELQFAIREAQRLCGMVIAPVSDPARRQRIALSEATNGVADLRSDDGMFKALVDMRYIPDRTAGDLPGFAGITFDSRQTLMHLLDRFVGDPDTRRQVSEPMRQAVLRHDTHDALVGRIIKAFAGADHQT